MNRFALRSALLGTLLLAGIAQAAPAAPAAPAGHGALAPAAQLPNKGKVLSTIDASQYTYIEVQVDKKVVWLAAPAIQLKKDAVIRFDEGAQMTNFFSKTLNRTFPVVYFVNAVVVTPEKA